MLAFVLRPANLPHEQLPVARTAATDQTGAFPPRRAGYLPRTADGLDLEYRAALASLPVQALPPELQATAHLLDDSAEQLRSALSVTPDSLFLLDQLRRVYARRLDLGRTTRLS